MKNAVQFVVAALFVCVAFFGEPMAAESSAQVLFAIIHQPGPRWQEKVDFRNQPGVMDHVQYYSQFLSSGELKLGGPLLDNSGGMAIVSVGSWEKAQEIASSDPAVKSGLLTFTIRPWMVPFNAYQDEDDLKSIVMILQVPVSVEQLWKLWTENSEITSWLAPKAHVVADVHGPYELFWEPAHPDRNSTIGCVITEIKKHSVLAFNWKGPVPYADLMNVDPLPTFVRVTFKSLGPNTSSVRLEHGGWGAGSRWAEARQWQEQAWSGAFAELAKVTSGGNRL
jgi:uncharacterized protein YciI/uncharacterized protein YndB with AHSA1/START domain